MAELISPATMGFVNIGSNKYTLFDELSLLKSIKWKKTYQRISLREVLAQNVLVLASASAKGKHTENTFLI